MKKVITAFKEHKTFQHLRPWDANTLFFPSDLTTPPHYADTIEVLLCCNVLGEIYIGGQKTDLSGKQVFYIPPGAVHAVYYKKSEGYVHVLKINVEQLDPFFQIEQILKLEGKDFFSLPTIIPASDAIESISNIFFHSQHLFEVIGAIAQLFDLLLYYSSQASEYILESAVSNENLRQVILWTEKHFSEKIALEQVAAIMGYEKHYFCNKFKELTGISYGKYLNTLRINYACQLLKNGLSVSDVCEKCGFQNTSYFIQLFKKTTGLTPKKYLSIN